MPTTDLASTRLRRGRPRPLAHPVASGPPAGTLAEEFARWGVS